MQSQWIFISGQWKCERQRKTTTKGQKHKWTNIFPQDVLEMETFINQIQLQARFSPNSEFLYISVKSQTSEEISFQDFV